MKLPKTKFTAVGDMLIQRIISTEYEGFRTIRDYICKGEARFFNFESIIYRDGIWGNQFNGGSFHNSDPRTLDIAEEYGFNMMTFANNHTFDWGYSTWLLCKHRGSDRTCQGHRTFSRHL